MAVGGTLRMPCRLTWQATSEATPFRTERPKPVMERYRTVT
jgi:hypothetical protein